MKRTKKHTWNKKKILELTNRTTHNNNSRGDKHNPFTIEQCYDLVVQCIGENRVREKKFRV